MRRSSKDPLNLGNVKMHARFEALDVVGFVAGVRYALSQIESGKAQVTCGRHLPCRHCNDVTVATEPETPSYIPNLSTDGQQKPCDARCGHDNHRIGCLNDPASEAACKCDCNSCRVRNRLTDRRKQRERASSDPTPDLRDAIKAMEHVRNYAEAGTYFPAFSRAQIDAVLSTLGEPK